MRNPIFSLFQGEQKNESQTLKTLNGKISTIHNPEGTVNTINDNSHAWTASVSKLKKKKKNLVEVEWSV